MCKGDPRPALPDETEGPKAEGETETEGIDSRIKRLVKASNLINFRYNNCRHIHHVMGPLASQYP